MARPAKAMIARSWPITTRPAATPRRARYRSGEGDPRLGHGVDGHASSAVNVEANWWLESGFAPATCSARWRKTASVVPRSRWRPPITAVSSWASARTNPQNGRSSTSIFEKDFEEGVERPRSIPTIEGIIVQEYGPLGERVMMQVRVKYSTRAHRGNTSPRPQVLPRPEHASRRGPACAMVLHGTNASRGATLRRPRSPAGNSPTRSLPKALDVSNG